jgi:hypothetical protein
MRGTARSLPAAGLVRLMSDTGVRCRRRRTGGPVAYPFALLVAAAALSLAAQLAVAKPGFSGGLLSAVPALAFMALAKLVLGTEPAGPATRHHPASIPADPAHVEPVHQAAPSPAPAVTAPPVAGVRPAGVVPVPATAFTRLNGTPVNSAQVSR